MIKNHLLIAVRTLRKNPGYSFINITGLAAGMGVALLIGLWIWDELTFNKYYRNYDRIAQVWQHNTINGVKGSGFANPHLMAEEIRNNFAGDFKYVLQSTWNFSRILSVGDKIFSKAGMYWEPQVIDMLSLRMLRGTTNALKEPYSIILSESVAKAFFGDADPLNQTMRINNGSSVKVTGVYEDIPHNANFRDMSWVMPWELYVIESDFIKQMDNPWGNNFTQTWAQLADNADLEQVSAKIINVKYNKLSSETERTSRPEVFLHPMSKWHLYQEFKNGKNTGGRIEFVWLFGIIGTFVLLLACINFMNLSTARSEKRAKEVGIRKSVGSVRSQLIGQFFSESLIVTLLAFGVSLLLVQLALPFFNQVADKKLMLLWHNPLFWMIGIGFSIFTAIIAGSYPALYLSSFRPVKVLKGTFRAGKNASIPRKVLVVFQSAVSVMLIIGTVIVFKQIEFAKDRPIGYDRNGLINIPQITDDIHKHFDAIRHELISAGTILDAAESGSPLTAVWNNNGGFTWQGKDPSLSVSFANNGVTYEYGKTVGWKFKEGRDFSRDFATDSLAFVINETAARFLGFEVPVGEQLKWNDQSYTIIGVINDMVIESPYMAIQPQLFHIDLDRGNVVILKLNPEKSSQESLGKIREVLGKYNPSSPFEYEFVDEEYGRKFEGEMRIGKLASFFAILAIFISCLGIFGLASFMAEQRTKEIGVRKVLGASTVNLWVLLSKDFVTLVTISLFIAVPAAWYFLSEWLTKYEYRTEIAWWIFVAAGAGALLITLATVSYQSIKAALANPVKSLRTE
jgi:ABC-type antimicrobial peptide transport system permease subunit